MTPDGIPFAFHNRPCRTTKSAPAGRHDERGRSGDPNPSGSPTSRPAAGKTPCRNLPRPVKKELRAIKPAASINTANGALATLILQPVKPNRQAGLPPGSIILMQNPLPHRLIQQTNRLPHRRLGSFGIPTGHRPPGADNRRPGSTPDTLIASVTLNRLAYRLPGWQSSPPLVRLTVPKPVLTTPL